MLNGKIEAHGIGEIDIQLIEQVLLFLICAPVWSMMQHRAKGSTLKNKKNREKQWEKVIDYSQGKHPAVCTVVSPSKLHQSQTKTGKNAWENWENVQILNCIEHTQVKHYENHSKSESHSSGCFMVDCEGLTRHYGTWVVNALSIQLRFHAFFWRETNVLWVAGSFFPASLPFSRASRKFPCSRVMALSSTRRWISSGWRFWLTDL